MLDMAFQLLTFFILTFKPSPVEGQITLRMPPPQSITPVAGGQGSRQGRKEHRSAQRAQNPVITVLPNGPGGLGQMMVGEDLVGSVNRLNDRLKEIFGNAGTPFDQVIIQVRLRSAVRRADERDRCLHAANSAQRRTAEQIELCRPVGRPEILLDRDDRPGPACFPGSSRRHGTISRSAIGRLFRGGELPRLMSLVCMLFVLGMLIRKASDVDTWRFPYR